MNQTRSERTLLGRSGAAFSLVQHREVGFLFASVNDAALRLFGTETRAVLGERLCRVVAPGLAEVMHARALECLATQLPTAFVDRAGSNMVYLMSPLGLGSRLVSVTALPSDMLARLPMILEEQQHLASVGRLSRGVAHDVNNVLGAALIALSTAKRSTSHESVMCQRLTLVEDALELSTLLLRRVLVVSNEQTSPVEQLQLSDVVSEVVNLVRPLLPHNVHMRLEFAPDVPQVSGARSALMQVVLNLCLNAMHATEESSGSVSVSVTEEHLLEPLSSGHCELLPGPYACLVVSDSGQGMSAQTLSRAFEPFFTTHPGVGTGLGLSIVRSAVEAHGGAVVVQSTLGVGTTVSVYLPAARQPVPGPPASS